MRALGVVSVLLVLLLPSIATSTLGPPVKLRLLDELHAESGKILTFRAEIEAGAPITIEDLIAEGEGWSVLSIDAPSAAVLDPSQSMEVTIRAIPLDPAAPLRIYFKVDGVVVGQTLDFSRPNTARDEPRELRVLEETSPTRAAFPNQERIKPDPFVLEVGDPVAGDDEGVTNKVPRNIRVHGRFVYQRDNPGPTFDTVGVDGLSVYIWDADFAGDQLLASTITDADGFFDITFLFSQCCEADPDIYIKFVSHNGVVEVEEPGLLELDYTWQVGEWHNFSGTDLDAGTITPLLEEDHGALHILTTVTRTWRWLLVNEGYNTPPTDVQWPANWNNSFYNQVWEEIHIVPNDTWLEWVVVHEYGHHWMQNFGNLPIAFYCNGFCDNSVPLECGHCAWCQENGNIAWSEGFADWMGDFLPETFAADYGLAANYIDDYESIWACPEDSQTHLPNWTEGFLAAVLNDIMDTAQDDDLYEPAAMDELSMGTNEIFFVAEQDTPSDPTDFLNQFLNRYNGVTSQLWATAKNNGFELDFAAPNQITGLYSTTHQIGVPDGDPTPQFLWDIPTDNVSGTDGFSVLISTNPALQPNFVKDLGVQNFYDSPPLAPDTYYMSIRAVDRAGNWSAFVTQYGPFIVDVPDPVDLQFLNAGGWDHPLVPRAFPDATPGNVHVSPVLIGLGTTYWSVPYINTGDLATFTGFDIGLGVDGVIIDSAAVLSAPSGSSQYLLNAGPVGVLGGRHTLTGVLDSGDAVAEEDETNNQWGHQWSWTPWSLVAADPPAEFRSPPDKTGGWSTVIDGSPVFFNCQGYRFSGTTGWYAAAADAHGANDDYDVRLHTFNAGNSGYDTPLHESARGRGKTDVVLVNRNQTPPGNVDVGVVNGNGGRGDYHIDLVQSTPLPVGGRETITFAKDVMVALRQVDVGPGETGGLTISASAVTGTDYSMYWYDQGTAMGVLTDGLSSTANHKGRALLEPTAGVQGSYALALVLDPDLEDPATEIQIKISPTLPDLTWTTPGGWYGPLVPRRFPDTNIFSVPMPTSLTGNANTTYFNFSFLNDSSSAAGPLSVDIHVDGRTYWTANFGGVGAASTQKTNNWGPHQVSGGRHTYSMTIDSADAVEETDEDNNVYGEQWVWSPWELLEGDTTTRQQPFDRTAAWDHIKGGVGTWYNCDGLFMDDFGQTCQGIAVMPNAGNNVDLRLHEASTGAQNGFDATLVTSSWGPDQSDFVIVNQGATTPRGFDVGVIAEGIVSGNYTAHAVSSISLGTNPTGEFGPYRIDEGEIFHLFDMQLDVGRWGFEVIQSVLSDDIDWGVSLHVQDTAFLSKSMTVPGGMAWMEELGRSEFVSVDVLETTTYCLAVWKATSQDLPNPGQYILRVYDLNSVDVPATTPVTFALHANTPNPFNPSTSIRFDLPKAATTTLLIYDVAGRRVRTLLQDEALPAGRHSLEWGGRDDRGHRAASGMYFAHIRAGALQAVHKMTLVK